MAHQTWWSRLLLRVTDLRSTNGTYLGEERLTDITPVGVGSQLRIGRTVLELRK